MVAKWGVIPDFLMEREVGHTVHELIVSIPMHERKKKMADLGRCLHCPARRLGDLDELAEILTWRQLDSFINHRSIEYKTPFSLLDFPVNHMSEKGFVRPDNLTF